MCKAWFALTVRKKTRNHGDNYKNKENWTGAIDSVQELKTMEKRTKFALQAQFRLFVLA